MNGSGPTTKSTVISSHPRRRNPRQSIRTRDVSRWQQRRPIVGNSVSEGRNAGQAARNAEFVFHRRATRSRPTPSVADDRRLLNRAEMSDQCSSRQCSREIDQTHMQVIDDRGESRCTNQRHDPGWCQLGDPAPEDSDIRVTVQARWIKIPSGSAWCSRKASAQERARL